MHHILDRIIQEPSNASGLIHKIVWQHSSIWIVVLYYLLLRINQEEAFHNCLSYLKYYVQIFMVLGKYSYPYPIHPSIYQSL